MKKSFLLSLLLLLTSSLFAQKKTYSNADDNAPIVDQAPLDWQAPVVTCLTGLNVHLPQSGQVTLWASDFLQSVQDNKTPTGEIKIGIRKSGTGTGFPVDLNGNPKTSVTFKCTELGLQGIELWAIDHAGNADYCETVTRLLDNIGICDTEYDSIQVCIHSGCDGAPMEGVVVNLNVVQPFQPPFPLVSDSVTGPNGCANVYVPPFNNTFVITPEIDGDPLNGVTTYDLLLIGKHILGLEPLGNPYKMIAADANKSGSISAFDLVELRKLIMGIYTQLPNNTSWRFVDAGFQFPNPTNPFQTAFPETIGMEDGQYPDSLAYVGMKIGDVDCTAMFNSGPPPDYPDVFLAMPDTVLQSGQVYDLPLFMSENGLWHGYQFGLNFDAQKLELQGLAYHNLTGPGNWNTLLASQGKLTTSWIQSNEPGAFGPDAPIAILRFRALENLSLKDIVTLSSQVLHPEGYAGWSAEKRDLHLSFVRQLKPKTSDPNADKNAPIFDPLPNLDLTAPVVNCLNGLSVNVMPTGAIQLWATDFLASVSDNVTPTDQIKIGIRKAGTGFSFPVDTLGNPVQGLLFACNELGANEVELWAKDLKGNTAHCLTYVIVQDNLGSCLEPPPGDWMIEICAGTENVDGVEELEFIVNGFNPNGPFYALEVTGPNDGCGYFDVPLGSNVEVAPLKDDNPLNGVTTYDVVLIEKHILGIEPLNSPYKMIAADADRNGVIDTNDIEELRKLIYGIYTELPNNTSWRFVDKNYVFPDPNNPFATVFPESLTVQNIQSPVSADFIAIKVGDVNNTAVANSHSPMIDERSEVTATPSFGHPYPNPTDGSAMLPVYLPNAEILRIEISDLAGRLFWVNDLQLEKGEQQLEIPAVAMPGKGVYVWRVWAGDMVNAGKLVRM